MNIVVVNGSMRKESQSLKVSTWLAEHAKSLDVQSEVLDLHKVRLPLYDVGETSAPNAEKVQGMLENADAVVFVSPEWNGMMSHAIVNMQHYTGKQLAHKPVMLVGVSSGRGGAYPIMQMRTMGYKNNQYFISPESLLVQEVTTVLNDHEMDVEGADKSVKSRADYALKILVEYAKAAEKVRSSGVVDHDAFTNGV